VNAALVGRLVGRWRPGQPFAATADERAAADAEIAAGAKAIGPNDAASTYHCRCGRELLRGARWGRAMAEYAKAAVGTPTRLEAYKGLAAATVRAGAAPADLRRAAAVR
jgi:hypothetical protein